MTKIFAVTAPVVRETKMMSYKFMMADGAPRDITTCKTFGVLSLAAKGENYIDPFKLAQNEPGGFGDDGVNRWNLHLFQSQVGEIFGGSVNESPPAEEGLSSLLKDAMEKGENVALLMQRDTFERFEGAANVLGIEVVAHHHTKELSTS